MTNEQFETFARIMNYLSDNYPERKMDLGLVEHYFHLAGASKLHALIRS